MAAFNRETVTHVEHWTDKLFSFKTTRNATFRFKNGYFTMIGLEIEGRPLLRAYSMASANYEDELEFFSIKVPDGPLTSRLQNIQVGDELLVGKKPTGTLVLDNLLPGKHLYLLSTGTGLAPFLSLIKDPEIYENFDKIVLVHCVRHTPDLAYLSYITEELPQVEYIGDIIREKLIYYPTVTRAPFYNQGRITQLIESGTLGPKVGLPPIQPENDRFMLCGSPGMLKDCCQLLASQGFSEYSGGENGHIVIERAFVDR